MSVNQQTVLLIEEEATLRDIVSFRLELLGYHVEAVTSAEDALIALQGELPGIVVVGHYLPGMDGIEFLNRLSNEVRTSEIPTMLLSQNSDLEDVQKAFNAGVDEYLVTPFDPQTLERKLERLQEVTSGGNKLPSAIH